MNAARAWLPQVGIIFFSAFFAVVQTFYLSAATTHLSDSLGISLLGAVFACLFLAILAVSQLILAVPPRVRIGVLLLLALGTALAYAWPADTTARSAIANDDPDVSASTRAAPEWDAPHSAFYLHPHFDDQHPVEQVTLWVPYRAREVTIDASKPKASVQAADGTLLGDGVEVIVTIISRGGEARVLPTIVLTPRDVVRNGWHRISVALGPDDQFIKVKVTPGPPGSTTLYDTTMVAVSFEGIGLQLAQLGRYSFGLIILAALTLAASSRMFSPGMAANWKATLSALWRTATNGAVLAFCTAVFAITATYEALSDTVLSYDPVRYFLKADAAVTALKSTSLLSVLGDALATNADEYTEWAALPPAILTFLFPDFSLVSYVFANAIVYLIPAALACGALGYALIEPQLPRDDPIAKPNKPALVALGAAAGLALAPIYFSVFLWPFPDIGGVVLGCALIFSVSLLCESLVTPNPAGDNDWDLLVARSAWIVSLAVAIFLFRRWYVFLAGGVVFAAVTWIGAKCYESGFKIPRFLPRLSLVTAVGLLTFLALLADVVVDWARTASQHNYAESYSGYWTGYLSVIGDLVDAFGVIVPILAIAICAACVARGWRALPVILLTGCLLAFCGLLTVQSPVPHHYYVLMPLISGSLAAGAIWVASKQGQRFASLAVIALGVIMTGVVPMPPTAFSGLIPVPGLLAPPIREDIPQITRIVDWVVANVGPDERYCVISSSDIFNITIVQNFWQRVPMLRKKMPSSVALGEVDSRDGPPSQEVGDCNVALVADPVQIHLDDPEQNTVRLVADDLLDGYGIGAAFKRAGEPFQLKDDVKVIPFKRVRPIEDAEYKALREEFYKSKEPAEQEYRARFPPPR